MNMNKRPRISLDLLKGFEAAARHMSFTLAAKELCVTQSAVSRQVKLLEEQTGQTLFLRVNRGLLLTSAGQTLFSAVGQANALVYDAIDALVDDPHTPSLLVAAATPFATMVIAPSLHGFLAHSEVRNVRIQSSNEPAELERIAAHVQIRHFAPGAAPSGAVCLAHDRVLPVCAPALLTMPVRPLIKASDLENQVLLRYETVVEGRVKIDWMRWLQANDLAGLRPRGAVSFSHYDQVISAAVAGCGIAMGRLPLVQRLLSDGQLVAPFGDCGIETGAWYALVIQEPRMADQQRAFLTWLKSVLAQRPLNLPAEPRRLRGAKGA